MHLKRNTAGQAQLIFSFLLSPVALRKAKIVNHFGRSECNRDKEYTSKNLSLPLITKWLPFQQETHILNFYDSGASVMV